MLYNYVFSFYLLYYFSAIVHETFHVAAAAILKMQITGLVIGENILCVSFGKLRISPLLIRTSYVEVAARSLEVQSFKNIAFFFVSGSIGNILLIMLTYYCVTNPLFRLWMIIINSFYVILNMLPIMPGNDLIMIFKLRQKK